MHSFGIWINPHKDPQLKVTSTIVEHVKRAGGVCCTFSSTHIPMPNGLEQVNESSFYARAECVLVVGGDGSLLAAARSVAPRGIPMLGINAGRRGFLAEVELPQIPQAVERLVMDRITLEKRMMLNVSVIQGKEPGVKRFFLALNDAVITRKGAARMLHLLIEMDGKRLDEYRADGMLVSTPTGSTAYALSVGGPILLPSMSCLLTAPICAHTLFSRPIVVDGDAELTVRVLNPEEDAILTMDGQQGYDIGPNDIICIKKSETQTTLIRLFERDFHQILHNKLTEWNTVNP